MSGVLKTKQIVILDYSIQDTRNNVDRRPVDPISEVNAMCQGVANIVDRRL
jgi:hypothetical protein